MSKKKSYMDSSNILKEGVVSYTLDKILKIFYATPALKKSKEVQNNLKDLNNSVKDLEKSLNDRLKKIGSKDKVKLKPYKIKDFMR